MDLGLNGKTALVPGSTSGLGLAVAQTLAAEGVRVAISGRRGDLAHRQAAELDGAAGFEVDLTESGSAKRLTDAVISELGAVDILILNSGGPAPGTAAGLDAETIQRATETLLLRQVELVSQVLPAMRATGWGRIVGLGSSGIQAPIPGLALSNIARAGLAGYLKTLAAEVAADGVTVNMVLPGRIATDRLASLDRAAAEREGVDLSDVQARSRAAIPIGRYGRPAEFGAIAAFLCSEQASYITGEQIRCDGGLVGAY
ncbi:SDR family oxidoreductase [Saxibacter everestensis]|uniref:SDR family oxidoreductase n=1 Tax=Saxibacter everestensis TaxID=2909229 RepID=A0ABY8QS74_9MICO|nr:SDR family oxidoreductase [Brevibacteriaceae bacterium ZFBP1038]